jgi:hypothetical protein
MIMKETGMRTEKRQSPRVKTSIPVRCKELHDGADTVGVDLHTDDLGTGGLRFKANKILSIASRVLLEFNIPNRSKPITAVSQVAWVRQENGAADSHYTIGSQFMEITEKDRDAIASYIWA